MRSFEFRSVTGEVLRRLHRERLSRDFPPNERKPLVMLEDLVRQGINSVWTVEREGVPAAYFILARLPGQDAILLDYFAVEPQLRGQGVGSAVLRKLVDSLAPEQYLLIESERPDCADTPEERRVRERRLDFYRRCGARWSGLCARLFGVDYALLTLGAQPAAPEQAYRAIYAAMLPEVRLRDSLDLNHLDTTQKKAPEMG